MLKKGHDRLKFGDIVNIEFSDETTQYFENDEELNKKKKHFMITASGFSFTDEGKIDVSQNIPGFQKDHQKNLFIIFPPLSNSFITNSSSLSEKIKAFSTKMDHVNFAESNKDDLNNIISAYNETKKDISNSDFLDIIGQTIKFSDKFILIHYQSQTLLTVAEYKKIQENRLVLCDNYSENSIFVFDAFNKYDNSADEVFSGQSIYIRKSEKFAWANNPYLYQKIIKNIPDNENKKDLDLAPTSKKHKSVTYFVENEEETRKKRNFSTQKSKRIVVSIHF